MPVNTKENILPEIKKLSIDQNKVRKDRLKGVKKIKKAK